MLLPKMAANLMRSHSGTFFSLASAKTRLSKSSQLSSRLIKMFSGLSKAMLLLFLYGRLHTGKTRPAFDHALGNAAYGGNVL